MKNEETLVNNDIQIPIELNISPEQSLNQKEEYNIEYIIKKHNKKWLLFFL